MKNAVLRNVIWLGAGEMVSRLLIFGLLIAVARVLGVHGYGIFAFGFSIASLVLIVAQFGIPGSLASTFGGTSLLIVVGVAMDTVAQVETHLLSRHYDGFLGSKMGGRFKGRKG